MDPIVVIVLGNVGVFFLIWVVKKLFFSPKPGPPTEIPHSRDERAITGSREAPSPTAKENAIAVDFPVSTEEKPTPSVEKRVTESLAEEKSERIVIEEVNDEHLSKLIIDYSLDFPTRLSAIKEAGKRKLSQAVLPLIESLYDPDSNVSSAAAESLGIIGDPRAIEPMLDISRTLDLKLMNEYSERENEPNSATNADVKEENEEKSGKELIVSNPFKYKEMTTFSIDLLPKDYFQADGSTIPRKELVVKGLRDTDQQLRKMAAKVAIGLDDVELVEPLSEILNNPYEVESVRYLAAEALGGILDEKSFSALESAMLDENIAVRYSAAAAIGRFDTDKAVKALKEALSDPNEFVRSSVAYALGQINRPGSLEALIGAVNDSDEVVRFSVAKALGGLGQQDVVSALGNRLNTADRRVKVGIIEALGQVKNERAVKILRDYLRDPDLEISFQASLSLMNQESIEALEDLIEATRRLDEELVNWVKSGKPSSTEDYNPPESPGSFFEGADEDDQAGSPKEGEALVKLEEALKHESPNVRGCAANTLGDFTDHKAKLLLIAALVDPHEYVRATAISSLTKMKDPKVLGELFKLCDDESEDVRYALAKGIGNFSQDSSVVFMLNKLAEQDPSKDVKRIARKELERIKTEVQGGSS